MEDLDPSQDLRINANPTYSNHANNFTILREVITQLTFLDLHYKQFLILPAIVRNLQILSKMIHLMRLGFLSYVTISLTLKTYKLKISYNM